MSASAISDYLASSDVENDIFELDAGSPIHDISYEGNLSKWTNYLHGWQLRYLVLRDGTLSYYKSEFDTGYGCRGSVSVAKAAVEVHEFDNCRFDVNVGDCLYYLRASDSEERQRWVDVLEAAKHAESGYGSETHLPKAISSLSLTSQPSLHSTNSFHKSAGLREKLLEMETFRDILCRQTDTLQAYFDTCADTSTSNGTNNHRHIDMKDDEDIHNMDLDELSATPTPSSMAFLKSNTSINNEGIDFRGEAITFKATTAGVIQVLSHCIELMTKREEHWKQKLEREKEKTRKLSDKLKECVDTSKVSSQTQYLGGPDYIEGPHSKLNEEVFFDAVDTALDEEDANEEMDDISNENVAPPKPTSEIMSAPKHRLSKEVDTKGKENLLLLKEKVDREDAPWELVYEDVDMNVYKKEFEVDGIVCDPLKASCTIPGVTARECCHYFFDKDVRLDWEVSVEKIKVIEKLSENTIVFYQLHKRIWPAAQRDNCFISHMRSLGKDEVERLEKEVGNAWMVTNIPTDPESARDDRYVRVIANVIMVCQTFTTSEVKKKKYTRDNIATKLTYMAQVNPGGWAPPAVVRQIAKREYPKFLRKFSAFVQKVSKDKPLML